MYLKSNNKNLVIFFYLNNRNEYTKPFASVNYPGKSVYYAGMYLSKIDVSKIKGKILGTWYNDESYNIEVITKNQNNYEMNVFNSEYKVGEYNTFKIISKNKQETKFEEDRKGAAIKGVLYNINSNKQLEVFSQDRNKIKGIYNPANLDSIKAK